MIYTKTPSRESLHRKVSILNFYTICSSYIHLVSDFKNSLGGVYSGLISRQEEFTELFHVCDDFS